jgi:hypothetical protein
MKSRRSYHNIRSDFDGLNKDEKLRFVIDVVTDTARTFAEKDFAKVQSALDRTAQTIFGMASRMADSLNKASKAYEAEWEEVKPRKPTRKPTRARRSKKT